MNQVARVFVVINLLLSIGFLFAAATFLQQSTDWRSRHQAVSDEKDEIVQMKDKEISGLSETGAQLNRDLQTRNQKITQLTADKSDLETRLEAAGEAKQAAERAHETVLAANTRMTNEVEGLRVKVQDVDQLIDRYRTASMESAQARDDAEVEKTGVAAELDQAMAKIHQLERSLEGTNHQLTVTNTELDTYRKHYPPPSNPNQPALDGQVTRFDRATDLVQINKGTAAGVRIGHSWDVLRGSDYICTVVVDRVDAASSVGHVEIRGNNGAPRAGDRATKL